MTPEKGISSKRHKPSAALRAFLDPLDPGGYFDCGPARLRGLDDALLREARHRDRVIGDDSFQLVATDRGLIYCRPSISFAIAARWDQVTLGEPRGRDAVVLSIVWPAHGELNFTTSRRLAANIHRCWMQSTSETADAPERAGVDRAVTSPIAPWPDFGESSSAVPAARASTSSEWEIVDEIGSAGRSPREAEGDTARAGADVRKVRVAAKPDRRKTPKALRWERQKKAASLRRRKPSASQTAETWNPALHRDDMVPIADQLASADPDAVPGDGPLLRAAAYAAAVAAKFEVEVAAEPEPYVEPELEVEVAPEPEPELDVEVAPEPEPEPEPDVEVEPEPEPDVEVEPEPEPEPEATLEVTVEPEATAELPPMPPPQRRPVAAPPEQPTQSDLPPGFKYVVPPAATAPVPLTPQTPPPPTPVDADPGPSLAAVMNAATKTGEQYEAPPTVTGDHPRTGQVGGEAAESDRQTGGKPKRLASQATFGEPSWVGSSGSLVGATAAVSGLVLIATLAVASYRRGTEVAADVNPAGPAVSIIDHRRFQPSSHGGLGTGEMRDEGLAAETAPSGQPNSPGLAGSTDPTSTTGSGTAPVSSIPTWSQDGPRTCNSNYSGCVPDVADVDCPNDGDGPIYWPESAVVMGEDVYELDTDGDGEICEPDQPRLDQLVEGDREG